jgi:competence protein ComEA
MAPLPARPLLGWTPSAQLWLSLIGTLAALGLILVSGEGVSQRSIPVAPRLVVDPNTASPSILTALPHLGPAMIKRIVAAREQAPLRSLDDLDTRVRGIGPATLMALTPFLRFEQEDTESGSNPALAAGQPTRTVATRTVRLARTP